MAFNFYSLHSGEETGFGKTVPLWQLGSCSLRLLLMLWCAIKWSKRRSSATTVMLPWTWSTLKTGLGSRLIWGMELDNAILPDLALHMEKELEEEEAGGRPAAWLIMRTVLPCCPRLIRRKNQAGWMGRYRPGNQRGCFCKEQKETRTWWGLRWVSRLGRGRCQWRRALNRHCNAAHQRLVTLLLQLGVTCCLAKGDLYVQHFKEVYPISLDVLWCSQVGDNCVPWSRRQQIPCLCQLITSPTWHRDETRPFLESFQRGGIKGNCVFIHTIRL